MSVPFINGLHLGLHLAQSHEFGRHGLTLEPERLGLCLGRGDLLLRLDPDPVQVPLGLERQLLSGLFGLRLPAASCRESSILKVVRFTLIAR